MVIDNIFYESCVHCENTTSHGVYSKFTGASVTPVQFVHYERLQEHRFTLLLEIVVERICGMLRNNTQTLHIAQSSGLSSHNGYSSLDDTIRRIKFGKDRLLRDTR